MEPIELKFNTGRRYTAEGQIIKVKLGFDNNGGLHLVFDDTSRNITGRIRDFPGRLIDNQPLDIETVVMAAYDHGLYRDIGTDEFDHYLD